ncbi:hypothetical protein M011DRAFT_477833 [Sporormia fimetaria CBS 119925]|uniref:Uncharacterized protein n=1 Tax=Sporormia fimetaria CBS 119925 TaxID=1340428 RepID=A0A6A6VA61_9PLEO|nr:hypothetical protein M011DRAFT_477833 [Sporormia fimetaria CBS 119925]
MPIAAIIPAAAVPAIPIAGLVLTSSFTAAGAIIKCKTGRDRKCGKVGKLRVRTNVPDHLTNLGPDGLQDRLTRLARRQVGACNVPQYNFDMCHEDLKPVTVMTSRPAEGVAQFDNVPASCLNLATALTGGCGIEGPMPIICGSACMKYEGLTEEMFDKLSDFLTPYAAEE